MIKFTLKQAKIRKKHKASRIKILYTFCIDDTTEPYKGVRGKGTTSFIDDPQQNLPIVEKLLLKYTGNLDNEIAKYLINTTKTGESVVVEITPRSFLVHGIMVNTIRTMYLKSV